MCSGVPLVFLLTSIVKQVKWGTKLAAKTLKGCSTRGCAWLVLCFQFPAGCQTIYFWFNLHFYLTFAQKQTNTLRISSDRQDRVGRHEGRREREKKERGEKKNDGTEISQEHICWGNCSICARWRLVKWWDLEGCNRYGIVRLQSLFEVAFYSVRCSKQEVWAARTHTQADVAAAWCDL